MIMLVLSYNFLLIVRPLSSSISTSHRSRCEKGVYNPNARVTLWMMGGLCHTVEHPIEDTSRKGQPLYKGHLSCPKRYTQPPYKGQNDSVGVLYLEVPLHLGLHKLKSARKCIKGTVGMSLKIVGQ